ncbi:hypothetical protein BST95_06390 [Halioglobus japonicus]|uniref:Uncharacterized protein n=1 Tax=Halioglobus japonicus TaxID=930805 RepID=A0AAP8MDL8_9GAMM|nr:hypothetical protein [Halioglobus japonicus]AQA17921.1 hypothetical protein BST95_06390 [Halioglobus japonicus]PLW85883.1 hypothetical protein C0029_14945 [Halioglobus japonicus]GHD17996.1 hypothetical protein GCM10007052_25130 [Halioglobus japonicus]
MQVSKLTALALGLLLVQSASHAQERVYPKHSVDCQVITEKGTRGLVTLQANSLDIAEANAAGQIARTMTGTREAAVDVTECVMDGQSFSDSSFESWRKSLPR